jgi:phospholipid N-methyltransferase
MLAGLDFSAPGLRIVELGPGTGVFTREILARLAPDGRFIAIERDPVLASATRSRWPTVTCVCDSAERLAAITAEHGGLPIDHIVSGLPFASLPASTSRAIMDAIAATLAPQGTFTTFQYVHACGLPPAITFRREMTARLGNMRREAVVFRNLPPAFVLRWRKAADGQVRT